MRLKIGLYGLLVAMLVPAFASAQTPDPRDYEVGYFVPHNTTIINTYLRHQSGTKGRDYSADALALRATHILKYGNFVVTPLDLILPVTDTRLFTPISGVSPAFAAVPEDVKLTLHASGVGDLTFLPTIGHGLEQNAQDKTHTWYALTTYITAPTGKYDPNRRLNIGQNRWAINPLLMVGQRFWRAVTLEAMANVAFYTANKEYRVFSAPALAGQDLDLKQKPSVGYALHAAVDLHPLFFVGLSYLGAINGQRDFEVSTPGGTVTTRETDSTTVHTTRVNFGVRITPQTLVLFQWNEDVAGSEDAALGRFVGLRFSHAFFKPPTTPQRAPITDPSTAR